MICLEEQKEVTASVDLEVVEETVQDDDGEISKVLCKQMSRVSRNSLGVTRSATAKCCGGNGFDSRYKSRYS